MCAYDFQFYAIYQQTGMTKHQDGVVGIAPQQQDKKLHEGPSLVLELKKQGVIDRALVGLFVSRFHSKKHAIQIGDFDPSYVQGGSDNIHWYSLTV